MTPPASIVKICGITNAGDALAAAEAGASAIGFNFWPGSPRFIGPAAAARISGALPETILRVGVFVGETAEHITAIVREAGLEVAQIHGESGWSAGVRCWRAYRVEANGGLNIEHGESVEAILLDAAVPGLRGGTGRTFAWEAARGLQYRVIIAGGLDANNVRAAIRQARPWGVDACSKLESSPGRKDHEKMRAFITEALSELS